jgi:Tol biopolymer transport system component
LLLSSVLHAQRITARSGSIWSVDNDGHEKRITDSGKDYQPSLSADGRSIVFVRHTKVAPYENQPQEMQVLESELWIADAQERGEPKPVLRLPVASPDGRSLWSFFTPKFSPKGRYVYFLAEFAATSHALCRLDVSSGRAILLTDALDFEVIMKGPHRGQILAKIRTSGNAPDYGYTTPVYLLAPNGKKISRVAGEEANLERLVGRYNKGGPR